MGQKREFNLYRLVRPLLFEIDPEASHNLALSFLKKGCIPKSRHKDDPILRTHICGIDFPNPVGLAAGFDKQAEIPGELLDLGFGFVELGSITPKPQPGNPKPRLFRATQAGAVINRFGFNSDGFDVCAQRLAAYRDANTRNVHGVVGVNIGKNKESTDAAQDYVTGIERFAALGDYLTVNISSPNTAGLRDLQGRAPLMELLQKVMMARDAAAKKPPVFVKVAPDQTDAQIEDICEVVLATKVDGIIIGNTTITRPGAIPPQIAGEAGGLSGKPLMAMSTDVLGRFYKRTEGKVSLIGCGGISSGEDAYAKIRAGASLVQLYTALVFEGPGLVERIKRDLTALLQRDGFNSVREAVGANYT